MTIADLLERIGLAFERTFYLVMLGKFGDLALSDLGIIALIVVVSFPIFLIFLFVGLSVFGSVLIAIGTMFGGGKADLSQAEVESEMSVYLAHRRAEKSQRPLGYECNQCGCLFDHDPDGPDECPDCGSDETRVHVFGDK